MTELLSATARLNKALKKKKKKKKKQHKDRDTDKTGGGERIKTATKITLPQAVG